MAYAVDLLLSEEMIHRNIESPLISTHLRSLNVWEFLYSILFLLLVAGYCMYLVLTIQDTWIILRFGLAVACLAGYCMYLVLTIQDTWIILSSVYEEGRFCETFHLDYDGWRDCESCGKLVHCGCIVSFNNHLLLDFGGIICMECSRLNFLLARNRCLSLDPDIRARELNQEPSGQAPVEAQFWPTVTDLELQQVSRNPKVTLTPLFQKILTASDADLKLARLIIPKRCAEAFFPDISGLHGLRIKIQDTEGNEWEFLYRYWLNGGSRIYVLEGLRDYMVSKKWQPGDTVTFYRVEPGGKVVLGLGRAPAGKDLPRI